MAASLLSHAATLALRVAFARAMQQQHLPAFFLHGPAAAPARSRVLDADAAGRVLVGMVIFVLRVALWAAFLVVALAVLLPLLVLFASCVVAALVAIVAYLDRARESRSRARRLAVLSFVSLFLLTVAVVLMVVVLLAIVDGEE